MAVVSRSAVILLVLLFALPPTIHAETKDDVAAAPSTQATPRPRTNLTTVPDVTLNKAALTEEEQEEQRGMPSGRDYSWNNLPDGRVSFEVTATPAEILGYVRPRRAIFEHGAKLPLDKYHIKVIAANADLFKNVAKAFEQAFKLRVEDGSREVDAMRLEVADIKTLKALPRPDKADVDSPDLPEEAVFPGPRQAKPVQTPGQAVLQGPMWRLATRLTLELHLPVLDGTHLVAPYKINLKWQPDKPLEGLNKSLESQGLKLLPAKTGQEGIHIDPLAPATPPATAPARPAATN